MSTCIGHILKLVQYTFLLRSAVWQDCIIFQVTKFDSSFSRSEFIVDKVRLSESLCINSIFTRHAVLIKYTLIPLQCVYVIAVYGGGTNETV